MYWSNNLVEKYAAMTRYLKSPVYQLAPARYKTYPSVYCTKVAIAPAKGSSLVRKNAGMYN